MRKAISCLTINTAKKHSWTTSFYFGIADHTLYVDWAGFGLFQIQSTATMQPSSEQNIANK